MPLRAAAVDVGTNSIKIAVAELDGAGGIRVLADSSEIARLGEGVDKTGSLNPEAQDRALAAIARLLHTTEELGAEHCRIVATSAVRDAENRAEFAGRVKVSLGIDLEVLGEEEEGRLSYSAVALDPVLRSNSSELAVVDIGGGSTEVTFGTGSRVTFSRSARIGAVRLTERVIESDPPNAAEIADAALMAAEEIRCIVGERRSKRVAGVGGTAVNLARILKGVGRERTSEVHGVSISPSEFHDLLDLLSRMTCESRKGLIGLDPARADIIVAGAIILDRVMAHLEAEELTVSTRGLRYGVLYEILGIA